MQSRYPYSNRHNPAGRHFWLPVFFVVPLMSVLLLVLVTGTLQAAADGLAWGELRYPGRGNIRLEAGTVEAWIRYDGDLGEPEPGYSRYTVFQYSDPNGRMTMTLLFTGNDKRGGDPRYLFEIRAQDAQGRALRRNSGRWKLVPAVSAPLEHPGKPHHVAVGWDFNTLGIWISLNGKRVEDTHIPTPVRECMRAAASTGDIVFGRGGQYSPESHFLLDDIRISDISRAAQQLSARADQPSVLDPYTLVLDRLDSVSESEESRETIARYTAGYSDETGARILGAVQLVPGIHGKALTLYAPPK